MDGLVPHERKMLHAALKRCRFSVSESTHTPPRARSPVHSTSALTCRRGLRAVPWALQRGDKIVTQGAASSYFYLIEEGICEVSISFRDEQTGEQAQKFLVTMERGEHFGEMALLPGPPKPHAFFEKPKSK